MIEIQRHYYANFRTRQQNLESCTQIMDKMTARGDDVGAIRALIRNKLVTMGFRSYTVNSYLESLGLI